MLVTLAVLLLCEVSHAWFPRHTTVGVRTTVEPHRRRGLCHHHRASRESTAGSKLFALPGGFTLDRSAIPRGILWSRDSNNFPLIVLILLLLVRALPRKVKVPVPTMSLADVERFLWPAWLQSAIEKVKIPFLQTFMFIRLCIKVVLAKTMLLVGSIFRAISKTLNPAEEADLKDWNVCILSERESLSGGIIKYRFELPYASTTIPLYVGQEVSPHLFLPHPLLPLIQPLTCHCPPHVSFLSAYPFIQNSPADNVLGGREGQGFEGGLFPSVFQQRARIL